MKQKPPLTVNQVLKRLGYRIEKSEETSSEVFKMPLRAFDFNDVSCIFDPTSGRVLEMLVWPAVDEPDHKGLYWIDPEFETIYNKKVNKELFPPYFVASPNAILKIAEAVEAGREDWDRGLLEEITLYLTPAEKKAFSVSAKLQGQTRAEFFEEAMKDIVNKRNT